MAITINTNVSSLDAQRNVSKTQLGLSQAMSRLSSGLRINSGADDAAGLGVSESLKAQTRSMKQAERNAGDGVSLLQVADGGMNEMHDMLGRMRELAVQSSSGTLSDSQRDLVNTEFVELRSEIDRVAGSAEFNGTNLLNGTGSDVAVQVGIGTNTATDQITIASADLTSSGLGVDASTVDTSTNAQSALTAIDTAIDSVSTARATNGAQQNRFQYAISNLQSMQVNFSAANSRIRDTDIAEETAKLTKFQILQQAGASILSRSNSLSGIALSLLG